jgi:hypothetical protein
MLMVAGSFRLRGARWPLRENSRTDGFVPLGNVIGRAGPIWVSFPPGSWVPRLERFGVIP